MIRNSGLCLLLFASMGCAQLPSDEVIRGILKQRVDDYHQSVGIVVGMIDANGRKVVSYGALEKDIRAR
ncbi:MAG: hypothetical protein ABSG13_30945 [Bryobacteraceae bacterium]